MRRYPHWLTRLTTSRWPKRIICVDCTGAIASVGATGDRQVESLSSWSAVCLSESAGEYKQIQQIAGTTAVDWWRELERYLQHHGTVWIVSWRCTRVWSLLDLWRKLEHREVTLYGTDYRSQAEKAAAVQSVRQGQRDRFGAVSASALSGLLGKASGYMVVEDPPSIAQVQVKDAPGKVKWMDCRNHGLEAPAAAPQGAGVALWLANTITHMRDYATRYRLGSMCATAGSQAMTAWRTSYYIGGIYCDTDPRAARLSADGYCGGRCEGYRLRTRLPVCWHLDRRSAYACHQRDTRVPVRLRGCVDYRGSQESIADLDAERTIARVSIDCDEQCYPLKRDGLVIYPVGRYTTTLCGPELAEAIRAGHVRRVWEAATYDLEPALSEYATGLYAMRCAAEVNDRPAIATWAKRLLVALAGKLGQRARYWEHAPEMATDLQWGEWIGSDGAGGSCRYRALAGWVQRDTDRGVSPDSSVAIAGWITSAARVELLQCLRIAGWDEVYYCDTDSMILSEIGYLNMVEAGKMAQGVLGAWTVRGGPAECEVYGVKHYRFGGELTYAGRPRGTLVSAGDGQHHWYTPSPIESVRSRQRPEAARVLRAAEEMVPYRHGTESYGGRVLPIMLQEW